MLEAHASHLGIRDVTEQLGDGQVLGHAFLPLLKVVDTLLLGFIAPTKLAGEGV